MPSDPSGEASAVRSKRIWYCSLVRICLLALVVHVTRLSGHLPTGDRAVAAAGPLEDQELLLRSIVDVAEGTPDAASYFHRVLPTNEITLRVSGLCSLGGRLTPST